MKPLSILLTGFNTCHEPHYFSLALGYLKAYAMADPNIAKSVDLEIVDFCVDCNSTEQALLYFTSARPDIIGISCYCWNTAKVLDLCRLTKKVLPSTKLVLGGPEVGPIAGKLLLENPSVDVIVRGEGEKTFAELVNVYLKGGSLREVNGISFRKASEVISNPDRPLIESLDEIPSPYLTGVLKPRDEVTYLESFRGCPYHCAYCYEGKNYGPLRFFSIERTEAELKLILEDKNVGSFSFVDPVFNVKRKRVHELCDVIAKLNSSGKALHTIEISAEAVDETLVEKFKAAGIRSVETGPQASDPKTMSKINRRFDAERFSKGVRLLLEGGIDVLCDLIIGLPGDDLYRFAKSADFVFSLRPSNVVFSTLHVLPGTYLYDNANQLGLTFDEQPPHCVLYNQSFAFDEVKKAEILAASLSKEYNL